MASLASRGVHVHHSESGRSLAEHKNSASCRVAKAWWWRTRRVRETGRDRWAFRRKGVNSRTNYSRGCGRPEPSFSLKSQVIELGFHEDAAPRRLGSLRCLDHVVSVSGDAFRGARQKFDLLRNEFAVAFFAESRTRRSLTAVSPARTSLPF